MRIFSNSKLAISAPRPNGSFDRRSRRIGARSESLLRGKNKKSDEVEKTVAEELGDVLFVTMIMANSLDIDLTEVFEENMAKFNQRDAYRFERKDGKVNETD